MKIATIIVRWDINKTGQCFSLDADKLASNRFLDNNKTWLRNLHSDWFRSPFSLLYLYLSHMWGWEQQQRKVIDPLSSTVLYMSRTGHLWGRLVWRNWLLGTEKFCLYTPSYMWCYLDDRLNGISIIYVLTNILSIPIVSGLDLSSFIYLCLTTLRVPIRKRVSWTFLCCYYFLLYNIKITIFPSIRL
jgi:hypothetical protein